MAGTPGTGRAERGRTAAGSRRRRGARSARSGPTAPPRRPAKRSPGRWARSAALSAAELRTPGPRPRRFKGSRGRASRPPPALPPATGRGRRRERAGRLPGRARAPDQGRSGAVARWSVPPRPGAERGERGRVRQKVPCCGERRPSPPPAPRECAGSKLSGVKACSRRVAS